MVTGIFRSLWWENFLKKSTDMLGWFRRYNAEENALIHADNVEDYNYHVCLNTDSIAYTAFKSLDSMYEFIFSGETERCYYEMISGLMPQKIYFDVDIAGSNRLLGIGVVTELILEIEAKLEAYEVEPEIMVFSSCGENKQSYHVIVSNVCVKTAEHNKSFAHQVRRGLSRENREYVDILYKSSQQFRLVNNTKYKQNRYKKFVPDLSSAEMKSNKEIFEASLVGNTEGCMLINIPLREKNDLDRSQSMEYCEIERRLKLRGITGFDYGKTVDNIVCLTRIKPTFCKLCKREHDAENAFVIVSDTIRFYCRRNSNNDFIDLGVSQSKLKSMDAFEAFGVM